MWLLENLGDIFEGKRLWLRPGKLNLFGRTSAEAGQLVISEKSISRKHLTIQVDSVKDGDGRICHSRTPVKIHDLKSKMGTLVDGVQIRGQTHVLTGDSTDIKIGNCNKLFRITWYPVIFSFSFTSRELRSDPWTTLRDNLEQLDIKYNSEYMPATTHVISKKRNTAKGLQALIDGKYIVADTFIEAVKQAAVLPDGGDGSEPSPLERDFDGNWPNALEHLPPRGGELGDQPASAYAPDERRGDIFDGYTFVFYDKSQYDNLFPVIATGKGKALLKEVVPGETAVDEFNQYVKEVAGEKGLGVFEDGSEGKGVVVVKFAPDKGAHCDWFANFTTSVSLRLDHRLINQKEFLEAILAVEAAMLRRPLEVFYGSQPEPAHAQRHSAGQPTTMEVDRPGGIQGVAEPAEEAREEAPQPRTTRARTRRAVASRFKGFDSDDDDDGDAAPAELPSAAPAPEDQMFVSQAGHSQGRQAAPRGTRSSQTQTRRKRPATEPMEQEDVLDGIAPTAAAVKSRRIAAGQEPVPSREATAEAEGEAETSQPGNGKSEKTNKKKGKESEILDLARQRREETEKRAAAERERLQQMPDDDIDSEEIRRLTIVEEMSVRKPGTASRTRERDIADGRWDASWNGRRNFKRFRKQGEAAGRPLQRVMVGLEPVKAKEYGIGDDYWLEDSGEVTKKKEHSRLSESWAAEASPSDVPKTGAKGKGKGKAKATSALSRAIEGASDSDGGDDDTTNLDTLPEPEPEPDLPRTKAGKAAERAATRQTQAQTQAQSHSLRSGKRVAETSAPREKPTKKPRKVIELKDSDDSDDELRFRFGRR